MAVLWAVAGAVAGASGVAGGGVMFPFFNGWRVRYFLSQTTYL
jgi:hypothetical protein